MNHARMRADRLLRHLKLKELRVVAEIAQRGSILGASLSLGSTQPALTRLLAAVEAKLEVKLFDRLPRGVRPTVFGEAILRRIAVIFSEIRAAEDDIASLNGLTRGSVAVGAMPLAAAGIVPEALKRVFAGRPGLRATVLEGNPEFLLAELRARRIEVIVGRLALAGNERGLDKEVLYDETLIVVARGLHPLHRRRRLRLADLEEAAWILPPAETAFYSQVATMFDQAQCAIPLERIRTLSAPVNLGMVMRSDFVTIVPRSLLTLGFLPSSVKPLKVALPSTRGPVGFIRPAGASETPALREFLACTRAVAATLS